MSQVFAHKTFLLSRTDSLGDVVLTLPLCGWIKRHIPGATILFLGKTYTRAIIESCPDVDAFLNWDELRAQAPARQVEILRHQHIDVAIHVFPNRTLPGCAGGPASPTASAPATAGFTGSPATTW